MKEAYEHNQTFETLIDQVEDVTEHAAAGKYPCTPRQPVNIACTLIFNTGVYHDDCNMWRTKPVVQKTWDAFKSFFANAHQDIRMSSQTDRSGGFQANNVMAGAQDSDTEVQGLEAIANLAIVHAEDKQDIATLTATNESIVAELIQVRIEFAAFRKSPRNLHGQ